MIPSGSALNAKPRYSHPPDQNGEDHLYREELWSRRVSRPKQHPEKEDREKEEHRRHGRRQNRVTHSRRYQEIEEEDDRKRQNQVRKEGQDRIDPPTEVTGRQPERHTDDKREQCRRRGNGQHELSAEHHPAEQIASQVIRAEEKRHSAFCVYDTRRFTFEQAELLDGIVERDHVGKHRGQDPEQDNGDTRHPDPAVVEMAVET